MHSVDDFFPELIEEVVYQRRTKSAAMNEQPAIELEQPANNAAKLRERIQAYMAQYDPARFQCELREMQKYFAHHGGDDWLQKHLVLVAKSRGQEAALKLQNQFYEFLCQ